MPSAKNKKNKELHKLRQLLISKRDELSNRIEQRRQEIVVDQEPDDEVGLALRNSSAGLAIANIEREIRLIAEVELALRLMDKGEYGICGVCGEEIPMLRLTAIPWTRRCIDCAGGGVRRSSGRDNLSLQGGLLTTT